MTYDSVYGLILVVVGCCWEVAAFYLTGPGVVWTGRCVIRRDSLTHSQDCRILRAHFCGVSLSGGGSNLLDVIETDDFVVIHFEGYLGKGGGGVTGSDPALLQM